MSLSLRRHHEKRLKRVVREKLKESALDVSDKSVGKGFSVHSSGCSCNVCGNPRKHFNQRTLQEERSDISFEEIE